MLGSVTLADGDECLCTLDLPAVGAGVRRMHWMAGEEESLLAACLEIRLDQEGDTALLESEGCNCLARRVSIA